MRASLIDLGLMGKILFCVKLGKDWASSVEEEVSWFGDVFCSRSWASYTATCRIKSNVYQNTQFLPCNHLPISLKFSCRTIPPSHCKTAKAVNQNIEIMKWLGQSPDLNTIKNLWKILGNQVRAKNPTTVTERLKKMEKKYFVLQWLQFSNFDHFVFLKIFFFF